MRLDKFLSNSGIGTRSNVRKIIKNKKIFVNDKCVTDISYSINENTDIIKFLNSVIVYKPYVYIMLNKPENVISATYDKKFKTVIDLLNGAYKTYNLFPVGRLDIDTKGLLILTNDGNLAHNLLAPKKHILKIYYVEHKNSLKDTDIKALENGVNIGDYITKNDAKVKVINEKSCYLTISEGKFHQVKRMFKAINNEVTFLKRMQMNKLKLDENLGEGQFRELTSDELKLLKE